MRLLTWFRNPLKRYFQASIYGRFVPYLRPYKWLMLVVVLISLAQVGFGALEPWSMVILVDSGLDQKPIPSWLLRVAPFLANASRAKIVVFAVLFGIVALLLKEAAIIGGEYLRSRVEGG